MGVARAFISLTVPEDLKTARQEDLDGSRERVEQADTGPQEAGSCNSLDVRKCIRAALCTFHRDFRPSDQTALGRYRR